MRMRLWRATAAGLLGMFLAAWAPGAYAFFPTGMFLAEDEYTDPKLVYARWTLRQMDTNGDGNIGADEGVPIIFHSGPDGLTAEEQQAVKDGMEVWENVPTAYVAFRYPFTIEQAMETSTDIGAADLYNFVTFDPSVVPAGLAAVSLVSFIPQSTTLTVNGVSVPVTGPAIIDADIAFDDTLVATIDEIDAASIIAGTARLPLKAVATAVTGLFIGLAFNPMENLSDAPLPGTAATLPVDPRVFNTGAGFVGVTPTMYPYAFFYDEGGGVFRLGHEDLAPDDLAGVSFLYPRGNLDNFFDLVHEARFDSSAGFPSAPIAGGFIQAWCDVDNNPDTPRVPMYSTITSLYEIKAIRSGFFRLPFMYKQFQDPTGTLFSASYTITLSEIQTEPPTLPTGGGGTGGGGTGGGGTGGGEEEEEEKAAEDYDSTHRGVLNGGGGFTFSTGYPWQTFREGGRNIYSLAGATSGTPLYYDQIRRKIVSADSAKTLAEMLPGTRPMFGNAISDTVCPLNLAARTIPVKEGPDALRRFRDAVLLRTALGTALADAYYRAAPAMTAFLIEHRVMLGGVRMALIGFEWVVTHTWTLVAAAAGLALAWVGLRRRRAASCAVGVVLLAAALLMLPHPAAAQFLKMTTPDIVALSSEIIVGEVVAVECRTTEKNQIVTDVTIQVGDPLKGRSNRGGLVHFTQLGGEKDGVITYVPQYPVWRVGEEVLTFLQKNKVFGYMAVGGAGGKFRVVKEAGTGEKYLEAPSVPAKVNLDEVIKEIRERNGESGGEGKAADAKAASDESEEEQQTAKRVSLDEVTAYIKDVVREQERAAR